MLRRRRDVLRNSHGKISASEDVGVAVPFIRYADLEFK